MFIHLFYETKTYTFLFRKILISGRVFPIDFPPLNYWPGPMHLLSENPMRFSDNGILEVQTGLNNDGLGGMVG